MSRQEATEEYSRALRMGTREYKDAINRGGDPYPRVLDEFFDPAKADGTQYLGQVEVPMELIAGTKTMGRVNAFSRGFYPLLDTNTEFAQKWISLCDAHLTEGIRDPIECVEYLGRFYVVEGNKRVSVLHYYDAPRIPGIVTRLLPPKSEDPAIKTYYEFLDFYKLTGIYGVYFTNPGGYTKLFTSLGKAESEPWTDVERQAFKAGFTYFKEAYHTISSAQLPAEDGDALLAFLNIYSFSDLKSKTQTELVAALRTIWQDVQIASRPDPVSVSTQPGGPEKEGLLNRILSRPNRLKVAFVNERDPETSAWCRAHELGRLHLEEVFGGTVQTKAYNGAKPGIDAEAKIGKAVEEGADVVFTTTPPLVGASLRAAVHYPNVRILNCSVDMPYTRIRTYYCRIYEAKFITGAIAGAMTREDRVGYVGSYPIFGVPAGINAFALGLRMTNPRARVVLRWSCLPGDPMEEFREMGIHTISNRDVPTPERLTHEYGTYVRGKDGSLTPLGSPCWNWGRFYENVVRSILIGTWNKQKDSSDPRALNYWWGMSSGVVDVLLDDSLPPGVRRLAEILRQDLIEGRLDPFAGTIRAQDGRIINDGGRVLSTDEILHMDWLCENVDGVIPGFDQLLDMARNMVRLQGIYREAIPAEKVTT